MGGVSKARRKAGGTGPARSGVPAQGWIRMMREARDLSLRQLGNRLGVQGNSVHVAERREVEGGISIYQLRRIAQALECDLFYAFVPRPQAGADPAEANADEGPARRAP